MLWALGGRSPDQGKSLGKSALVIKNHISQHVVLVSRLVIAYSVA